MVDSRITHAPCNPLEVDVHEAYELAYWTRKLGCSADQLREAVRVVGRRAAAVDCYLAMGDLHRLRARPHRSMDLGR